MKESTEEKVLTASQRKSLVRRRNMMGQGTTMGPMMLLNAALFIFPLIYLIVLSFATNSGFGKMTYGLSFENFKAVFSGTYRTVLFSSLKMAFWVTILVSVFAYPYAYFVARKPKKYQSLLILLIMIPSWTNSLLRVYAIQNLMSTNGIINTILVNLHIVNEPIQMLSTDFAVYFGMVFTTIPFMILPLYSNMQKIDTSILEAGRDLGATNFQLFWKVIFPVSLPGLSSGIVLVFIPAMANFFITDMLGGGKSINVGNVIQSQFSTSNNWPMGSAVSIVLMVISCIVILGCNKFVDVKAHARKGR